MMPGPRPWASMTDENTTTPAKTIIEFTKRILISEAPLLLLSSTATFLGGICVRAHAQDALARRVNDLIDQPDRSAGKGRGDRQCDFSTRRQSRLGALPAPAYLHQLGWIRRNFAAPMHHVPFVVHHVEIELRMRVGIPELRHGRLHRIGLRIIVRNTRSMMPE